MGDQDERLREIIFEDRPLRHDCENCGDSGMAAVDKLPAGWRYLYQDGELAHSLDDLDRKTIIVCAVCFGLVTRVIKAWATAQS